MGSKAKDLIGAAVGAAVMIGTGGIGGVGFIGALKSAGMATFLKTTAINFALNVVSRSLAPKPSDLEAQQARSDITTVSPIESHKVLYGRAATGGTLVYSQLTTEDDQYLNMVVAFAGHEIRGFKRLLINGEDAVDSHRDYSTDIIYASDVTALSGSTWNHNFFVLEGDQLTLIGSVVGPTTIQFMERFGDNTIVWSKYYSASAGQVTAINEVIDVSEDFSDSNDTFYTAIISSASDSHVAMYKANRLVSSKYKDLIVVGLHDGENQDQYDWGLAGQVADSDYDWGTTEWDKGTTNSQVHGHYMANIAYAYIRCKYDQDVFGGQAPNVGVEAMGKPLLDPSDDTIKTTNRDLSNPALILFDYLTNEQYGCGIDRSEIDEDSFTSAKNLCNETLTFDDFGNGTFSAYADDRYSHDWGQWVGDELTAALPVTVGDTLVMNVGSGHNAYQETLTVTKIIEDGRGFITDFEWNTGDSTVNDVSFDYTIYRYRCDGVIDTKNSKRSNIDTILSTMAAKLTYTSGKFHLIPGEYVAPSGTINQIDIIGGLSIATRPPARDRYNRVQGIYQSANNEYIAASFEPYENSTAVSEDNDIVSAIDLQLPLTKNHKHAQMLAEIALDRSRLFKTIELTVGLIGLKYKVGDTVRLNYERASITNEIYEIIDLSIDLGEAPTVDLVLQEISDIYPTGDA